MNGTPVPVERAFAAYKAIPLEPGTNEVEFRIRAPLLQTARVVMGLNSLFWFGAILFLAFQIGYREKRKGDTQ